MGNGGRSWTEDIRRLWQILVRHRSGFIVCPRTHALALEPEFQSASELPFGQARRFCQFVNRLAVFSEVLRTARRLVQATASFANLVDRLTVLHHRTVHREAVRLCWVKGHPHHSNFTALPFGIRNLEEVGMVAAKVAALVRRHNARRWVVRKSLLHLAIVLNAVLGRRLSSEKMDVKAERLRGHVRSQDLLVNSLRERLQLRVFTSRNVVRDVELEWLA